MQFSDFTRTVDGDKITFSTSNPLTGITSIKYYSDNSSGTFSKKEFRWSFNRDYWSSWEDLNQSSLSSINIGANNFLFLEIRYISLSGVVTSFILYYDGAVQSPITTAQTAADDIIDSDYVASLTTPVNADTLNNQAGAYYLYRPNHTGLITQSTVINLVGNLNTIDYNIAQLYATYIPEVSLGAQFRWDAGSLWVDASVGQITFEYVDGSLVARDTLIAYNLNEINQLDASIIRIDASLGLADVTKAYVDGSLATRDTSIVYNLNEVNQLEASIVRIDAYQLIQDNSIYAFTANNVTFDYVDGSIAKAVNAVDTSLATYSSKLVLSAISSLVNYTVNAVDDVDTSLVAYTNARIITALNSSLALYETRLNLNSSFALYETILNLDSSFALYETILNLDSSFALYETILNLDSSFALYEIKANLDISFGNIYTDLDNIDTSLLLYETEVNLDSSFANIYMEIDRIDASLGLGDVTKKYVDGSIVAAINAVDISLVAYTINAVDKVDTSLTNYTSNSILSTISTLINYTVNAVDDVDTSLVSYTNARISSAINALDTSLVVYTVSGIDAVDTSLVAYTVSVIDAVDTSLTNYTYSQAYIDGSLAAKSEGITVAYVDGSIANAVNAVDTSLVTYTNAQISSAVDAVDTSLVTYTDAQISSAVDAVDTSLVTYVDLYNIIQDTSAYAEFNQLDASIDRIDAYQLIQDNSIAAFEANDVTFDYVDGSIATAVDAVDTSLVTYVDLYNIIQDTSVYVEFNQLDASIDRIDAYQLIQDNSIAAFEANDVTFDYVDGSIAAAVDAVDTSLVNYTYSQSYIDGSLALKSDGITAAYVDGSIVNFIKDSSFNPSDFVWNGVYFDVSTVATGVSRVYVDGSIVTAVNAVDISLVTYVDLYNIIQDTSTYAEFNQLEASIARIDASLGLGDVTKEYVDGSIAAAVNAVDISLVAYTVSAVNDVDSSLVTYTLGKVSNLITYTVNAINNVDSSLVNYTDATFVELAGDTMTGDLFIDSSLIVDGSITAGRIIAGSGIETSPALSITGDTGFYGGATSMATVIGGSKKMDLSTTILSGSTTGKFGIKVTGVASATNPVILPVSTDDNTGIGSAGVDQLSLIAGGVEGLRIDTSAFGGNTRVIVSPGDVGVSTGLYFGDGDTGFYESVDDTFYFQSAGATKWLFGGNIQGYASDSPAIMGSSANPNIVPNKNDLNTGIGQPAKRQDILSLIAGGVEGLRIDTSVFGGNTRVIVSPGEVGVSTGLWFGDGDTGIYEVSDDTLGFNFAGAKRMSISSTIMIGSTGTRFGIPITAIATDTLPVFLPNSGDTDTGIGRAGENVLSLISGGVERLRLDASGADVRGGRVGNLGNPQDASDAVNRYYVNAYNNIQDTSAYMELNQLEASIALINVSFDYIDGSIAAAVDAVDTSLVAYTVSAVDAVDTSLVAYTINAVNQVDISLVAYTVSAIGNLVNYIDGAIDDVDSSLVTYIAGERVEIDTSFGNVYVELNQLDASIIRIDASLGISFLQVLRDTSIGTNLADNDFLQYNVDTSMWENVSPLEASGYFISKTALDASLALYETILNLDSSFGLYETILNLDSSFGLYETKVNLDSSFGDVHTELNQLDASVVRIDAYNIIQDTSAYAEFNQLDASIVRIDASLGLADVTKAYVDTYNNIQDTSAYAELNQIEASIARIDTSIGTIPEFIYMKVDGSTTQRREGIRDDIFVRDKTLNSIGFAGVEDTDWENTYEEV